MNGLFRPEWSTLKKLIFLQSMGGETWNTISGNPVSFTAKAAPLRQLSVAFSPVQSLNGYDSPWPAGGGKNKCPDKKYQNSTQSVYIGQDNGTDFPLSLAATTYTLSFTLAQQMAIKVYIREEHDAGGTEIYNGSTENAVVAVSPSVAGKYRLAIFRQDGISVNDISNVQLELGSSATSWVPFENNCPISGWTALTVEQRGKNLLDIDRTAGTPSPTSFNTSPRVMDTKHYYRGITRNNLYIASNTTGVSIADGTLKLTSKNGGYGVGFPVEVAPSTKYILSATTTNGGVTLGWYGKDWGYLSNAGDPSTTQKKVTAPSNAKYALLMFVSTTVNEEATFTNVQFEIGDGDKTEYVPYNGRSISISLGQTVYSGTVDVLTGVVTVDKGYVDLGSLSWTRGSITGSGGTIYYFQASETPFASGFDTSGTIIDMVRPGKFMCDRYTCYMSRNLIKDVLTENGMAYTNNNGVLRIRDDQYETADAFKTALSGSICVFDLASSQTIQLTPQEVSSLLGENVLFSDANGDLTVTYRSN